MLLRFPQATAVLEWPECWPRAPPKPSFDKAAGRLHTAIPSSNLQLKR